MPPHIIKHQQTAAQKKLARPRGLWKARGTQSSTTQSSHALSSYSNSSSNSSSSGTTYSTHSRRSPTPAILALSSEYPASQLRHPRPLHPANGNASDYFQDYYYSSSDDSSYSSRASSPVDTPHQHHHSSVTSSSLSTTPFSNALIRPRKRRRVSSTTTPPTSVNSCCSECDAEREEEQVIYWDYSRSRACAPAHPSHPSSNSCCGIEEDKDKDNASTILSVESKWTMRSKLMDTSSIGLGIRDQPQTSFMPVVGLEYDDYVVQSPPVPPGPKASFDLEDWEDLKELFAKTAEMYETNPPEEVLPLLRGVIHECHRFMLAFPDPSVLYTVPPHGDEPESGIHAHGHGHHHHHRQPQHHLYYHDKGKNREMAIPIPGNWNNMDDPPLCTLLNRERVRFKQIRLWTLHPPHPSSLHRLPT
ncbi:hypothetical protein CPB84DRAFT_1496475 [Gymnopilus junonius]|uniref:Uncharacterized protein n=1 Tax=Gymnopilus junonius TaxID=109634 RepID=A0A9P5NY07_GYMJU|nr:hypothetical protein CPB84DRAFT_1496475 [Gymnopilus junonius]